MFVGHACRACLWGMLAGRACEPCKRVMQAGHHAVEPADGGAMCPAVIYK